MLKHIYESQSGKFSFSDKELAIGLKIKESTIRSCFDILIENGDAINLKTKDGFSIGKIQETINAYETEKYLNLENNKIFGITLNIDQSQRNYGLVDGNMNQSFKDDRDMSIQKSIVTKEKSKKNSFLQFLIKWWWTFVVPIVVGLIILAIEYFWFKK